MKRLLCVDSNISIYPAMYDHHAVSESGKARLMLQEIASGSVEACTSTLTWGEVWVARRLFGPQKASLLRESFLQLPNLKLLKVEMGIILRAQSFLEKILKYGI